MFFQNYPFSLAKIWSSMSVLVLMHCRFKVTLLLWRTASKSGLKVPWLLDVSCYRLYSHTLLHRSIWSIKCYFGFSYLTLICDPITNSRRRNKARYQDCYLSVSYICWHCIVYYWRYAMRKPNSHKHMQLSVVVMVLPIVFLFLSGFCPFLSSLTDISIF